jgi:hypothetical protein
MHLMVGWGFAFGRGFVILLWSIVWAIVAGIVAVLITGSTLTGIISNPTGFASNPTAYLGGFLLGIFLSVFIAVVGLYASIVKVTVDGAISQMEKSGLSERSSYSLGPQPTQTAPPMLRKYCPNCGTSIPGGTIKCPSCGATLS